MSVIKGIRLASCTVVALVMAPFPGMISSPTFFSTFPTFSSRPAVGGPVDGAGQFGPALPGAQADKKSGSGVRKANFGIASWYGAVLNGHRTASGEIFDMNKLTAAHRTLPFGTMVRVVDLHSGKSVVVRINDRGVLFQDRVIDLSLAAAERLGIRKSGITDVHLEVLNVKQAENAELAELDSGVPELPQ